MELRIPFLCIRITHATTAKHGTTIYCYNKIMNLSYRSTGVVLLIP